MRYRLKVYYETEATRNVTKWTREILDDWKRTKKTLEVCQIFEFTTDKPLSKKEIRKLETTKQDWMNKVEVEAVV